MSVGICYDIPYGLKWRRRTLSHLSPITAAYFPIKSITGVELNCKFKLNILVLYTKTNPKTLTSCRNPNIRKLDLFKVFCEVPIEREKLIAKQCCCRVVVAVSGDSARSGGAVHQCCEAILQTKTKTKSVVSC